MNYNNTSLALKIYGKNFFKKSMLNKGVQTVIAAISIISLLTLFFVLAVNLFSLAICTLATAFILNKVFGIDVIPHEYV